MTSSSLTSSIRIENLVRSCPEIETQTKTDDSSVRILMDLHFMIRNFQVIYNFIYLFIYLSFRNQKLLQKSLSQRRLKIKIFKQQKQLICVLQIQVQRQLIQVALK